MVHDAAEGALPRLDGLVGTLTPDPADGGIPPHRIRHERYSGPVTRARGIALVLAAGMLSLLFVSSLGFLAAARLSRAGASTRERDGASLLAADSGLEYAAARLSRGRGYPVYPLAQAGRGDDWAFRDTPGTPLARADNPSWSHGESWTDGDADGIRDPAEPGTDPDGDGRFSAWTSRLRPARTRFAIKTVSAEGLIPLNAGFLDGADRNGNGLPDHADPDLPPHRGLAHAASNLGTLLRPEALGPWTRRADVPAGTCIPGDAEPVRTSWLGFDLLRNRPAGGYRTWADVAQVLATIHLLNPPPHDAGGPYTPAEITLFEPYFDLGPYPGGTAFGPPVGDDGADVCEIPPVNLHTAPDPVRAALWMYLATEIANPIGSPADWIDMPYSRAGASNLTYADTGVSGRMPLLVSPDLDPGVSDEPARISAAARDVVRSPAPGWARLHERFDTDAALFFAREDEDTAGSGFPIAGGGWLQAKADLCAGAVSPDPPFHWGIPCVWTTRGLVTRALDSGGAESRPLAAVRWARISGVRFPPASGRPWSAGPNEPYVRGASPPPPLQPLRATLAPPRHFRVAARGWIPGTGGDRTLEARLAACERLEFTSQEDFENADGGRELARRGIIAQGQGTRAALSATVPNLDIPPLPPDFSRTHPHVVSLPRPAAAAAGGAPCSRFHGALALAPREADRQGADRYWSFRPETLAPGLRFPSEPPGDEIRVSRATDAGIQTSWWVSNAATPLVFDCPGFRDADASSDLVESASLETWLCPGGEDPAFFLIEGVEFPGSFIRVEATRTVRDAGSATEEPGTLFRLEIAWLNSDDLLETLDPPLDAFIPDFLDTGSVRPGFFHTVLTLDFDPEASRTNIRLFVDGAVLIGGAGGLQFPNPPDGVRNGLMKRPPLERLTVHRAGELRLYGKQLKQDLTRSDVADRFKLGRVVLPASPPAADPVSAPTNPTYVSPRYFLRGNAAFDQAHWTAFTSGELDDVTGMRVLVYAYDAAGTLRPGFPVALPGPGQTIDLPSAGGVRSFRYAVEFYRKQVPDAPLYDSPVFESVWFTLRAPAWTDWSAH